MKKIPEAIGPYSVYRKTGGILFVSGQLPINPESGEIDAKDVRGQAEQVMQTIGAILKENACSYEHIVKTTILLDDIKNFDTVNEVYASFFTPPFPARAAYQVAHLPKDAKVEIEVIAELNS